jgi:hypothetical protein
MVGTHATVRVNALAAFPAAVASVFDTTEWLAPEVPDGLNEKQIL